MSLYCFTGAFFLIEMSSKQSLIQRIRGRAYAKGEDYSLIYGLIDNTSNYEQRQPHLQSQEVVGQEQVINLWCTLFCPNEWGNFIGRGFYEAQNYLDSLIGDERLEENEK